MGGTVIDLGAARSKMAYDPATGALSRLAGRGGSKVMLRENEKGYYRIELGGRRYFAHRLAWYLHYGEWPSAMIDHINGDRKDNRIANLRLANQSQNSANAKRYSNNSTGYKGVSERRPGQFRASVRKDGKLRHLGTFSTPEAAYDAYVEAANDLHGSFARTA